MADSAEALSHQNPPPQTKTAPKARFLKNPKAVARGSALARLEAGVLLVDHVDTALAADHAAILVPFLYGFQ
jgi:hypothetical protein